MVKIGIFSIFIGIVAFAGSPLHAQERASLAVFPAVIADSARPSFGEGKLDAQELTRQLEETLRSTRRFSMFERSAEILMKSVRTEQEFAKGGQALNNAAEAGKLNNVQFIVQPIITQASISVRKMQLEETPGQYRYMASGSLNVTIKVLDTTSAEIMFQATRDVALRPDNQVGSRQSGAHDENLVLGAAWRALTTDAAARLTNSIVGSLSPIAVVGVQGADIFVNRGEGGGIFTGETYQIFSVGEALIDPTTNEKLGNAEELLGVVEISRVNPRFSVARAKATLTGKVKPGDVLRPPP
jgi:hypothetical protein